MESSSLRSAEEYLATSEDGRSELVRGQIVPLEFDGPRHGPVCGNVAFTLKAWVRARGTGLVLVGRTAVQTTFSLDSVRSADVAFVSHDRLPGGVPATKFERPPNLCVEVISPSDTWTKVIDKVGEYLNAGVDEIWIVDLAGKWVERHTANVPSNRFLDGDVLADCPALPGFASPVAEFFRDV